MATSGSSFSLSQLLTAAAPTTAAEGQSLQDLTALTVVVETAIPASQTLSGAGNLRCYVYDSYVAGWFRIPSLDLAVAATGVARMGFPALSVICPRASRILYVPDGVTVSAGTTVTVYQLGFEDGGRGVYR